jgi:hypothetical protein
MVRGYAKVRLGSQAYPSKIALDVEKYLRTYKVALRGSVAQSVEQRPFKALVPGSSPGRPKFFIGVTNSLAGP